ncbi:sulfite exporter TauE/SafE family protein [Methylocystis rosea]|uniref:Probable membrane transporter protein n=1 Tax=Methylocystis rosea TaxID=173366 RepID=A0A3G8MC03_9HYPH|nr:sulfite exporter TauE/SafE family protein [Methylocystis rosea]AZG78805.1 sulfite exporter TauE/SafE family protein [Methylocystis rosea]
MYFDWLIDHGQSIVFRESLLTWLVLIPIALVAGTVGGTVGFGSAVILIPICVYYFGASPTVPILTVAALLGNLSRAAFSWRETDWLACGVYVAGALPSAILGALIFIEIDAALIHRLLGLFILLMIPASRLMARFAMKVMLWQLFPIGVAMGLLSGVVGTVGPINAPFFLGYGLVKGAYLATEALGAAAVHLTKSLVYGRFAAIDPVSLANGLTIGMALIGGSYLGKQIVNRIDATRFRNLLELMLAVAGSLMLLGY